MKKLFGAALGVILGAAMLTGCDVNKTVSAPETTAAAAQAEGEAAESEEKTAGKSDIQLSFGGSSSGGVMYYMAGAFADIITPMVDGVNISNVTTGAAVDNAIKTATGELELSITYGAVCYEAATGTGNFENNQYTDQAQNIKGIGKGYDSDFYFVALEKSGITTLSDLEGKTVACGNAGSGTQYIADIILDAFEIDGKREYISFSDGAAAMKEGRVDVVCQSGSPSGALTELASTDSIVIIPFTEEEMDELIEKYPWFFEGVMSKDTYAGMTEDVLLPHFTVYIICNGGVDDDVMYQIMEAVYTPGTIEKLAAGHSNWKEFVEDIEGFEALGLEIHPGVKKFYEDHPEYCQQ